MIGSEGMLAVADRDHGEAPAQARNASSSSHLDDVEKAATQWPMSVGRASCLRLGDDGPAAAQRVEEFVHALRPGGRGAFCFARRRHAREVEEDVAA